MPFLSIPSIKAKPFFTMHCVRLPTTTTQAQAEDELVAVSVLPGCGGAVWSAKLRAQECPPAKPILSFHMEGVNHPCLRCAMTHNF